MRFIWCERSRLVFELDLDDWLAHLVDDLEERCFDVCGLATNHSLCVEDCIDGAHGDLILGRVIDETLCVNGGNDGRSDAVALVIGSDLDAVITEDPSPSTLLNSHRCFSYADNAVSHWPSRSGNKSYLKPVA